MVLRVQVPVAGHYSPHANLYRFSVDILRMRLGSKHPTGRVLAASGCQWVNVLRKLYIGRRLTPSPRAGYDRTSHRLLFSCVPVFSARTLAFVAQSIKIVDFQARGMNL